MPSLRAVAAAAVAVTVAGVHATEVELPPCLDPFRPFVYSGCFEDTGSPSALVWRTGLNQHNMTVEQCVSTCKGNGYRYAGLAYYGVCYCGQTVNGPQVDESQCSFPCSGNSSQTCGADRTLSVYTDPTFLPIDEVDVEDYAPLGCWTDDSPLGRALTYRQDIDGPFTTEKCLQKCKNGGFPFAGTEYGGECWCGIVIGNDTYSAPAEECSMPCNGNSSETCGGPSRLSLYVAEELQSLEPCGYQPPVPEPSSSAAPSSTANVTSSATEPPATSAASTTSSPGSSDTSSVPSESTATPPATTPPPAATTTTSSSLCVSTTTVPSTCEYKCGNWCSDPLPDWKDLSSCKSGFSSCKLQVASCFKKAGWPGSLECFEFSSWCQDVERYCGTTRQGWSKASFCKNKPPKSSVKPPTTTVITTTCAPATTAPATTKPATATTKPAATTSAATQCPIPTPTNICKQPSNWMYGYGPGNPVGGIELPIVSCNDLSDEHAKYPFKRYSEPDSRRCAKYPRNSCVNACNDACKDQYEDCIDVYAETCKRGGPGGPKKWKLRNYFEFGQSIEKRTFGLGWKDDYGRASEKCKSQYHDCLFVNRQSTGSGKCTKFALGPW